MNKPGTSRSINMSFEDGMTLALELNDPQTIECAGVTVYNGFHETYGSVHLITPMEGDAILLLPFASHSI